MLNLLIKDFKLMYIKKRGLASNILTGVLSLLFVACFVALECFLFTAVIGKIKNFSNAPKAFMTLFLAVISLLMIISNISKAKKLFFKEQDLKQLSAYPVTNSQIILSKMVFLFLSHFAVCFVFVYPLFFAYGQIFQKTMWFYYMAVFYPIFSFFFEMGVALMLVYPIWIFGQFVKKHIAVEFSIAMVVLILLSVAYSTVLNLFVDLVANNQLNTIFTEQSISQLIRVEKYFFPLNFLANIFIDKNYSSILPYSMFSLSFFVMGLSITIFAFNYVRNISIAESVKEKPHKIKLTSPIKALIKKELIMITKSAGYIFSFTGLLVVQPFLLYLIVSALNTIFSAGLFRYYLSLIPHFVSLMDFLMVVMFTLIINQGANNYITMEESTIKIMKTIPIDYKIQLRIKTAIPFILSEISLIISCFVLMITGTLSWSTGLVAMLFSSICLFIFDVVSLREELSVRHGKPRSTYLSSVYSYLLPFLFVAVGIVLSYLGLSIWIIYLVGMVIFAALGIPHILYIHKNMGSLFMDLEAHN